MNTPYPDLHIYYVKGHIREAEDRFDGGFIGNWQEDDAAFLFFASPADAQVDDLIRENSDLELIDRFHMPFADWHGGEIRTFSTQRFHVAPPWADPEPGDDRLGLVIDPGVVFGAGTHPTTRSCLEAVEIACEKCDIASALDLGAGTGLLGLAAARLGCQKVLAVDSIYLAAQTARENIERNRMGSRMLSVCADAAQLVEVPADLLIANIHFDVMRQIIVNPAFYEKKWFVLSGVLRSHARRVEELLCYGPGRIIQRWISEGIWYTYLGTCGGKA